MGVSRIRAVRRGTVLVGIAAAALACARSGAPGARDTGAAPSAVASAEPAKPTRFVTDFDRSEAAQSALGGRMRSTLLRGIREHAPAKVREALAPDFSGRFFTPEDGEALVDPSVTIRRPKAGVVLPILDAGGLVAAVERSFGGWSLIERSSWRNFSFLLDESGRWAHAAAHVRIGGVAGDQSRRELVATVEVEAVLAGGEWTIRRLAVPEAYWSEVALPPFREVGDVSGFGFNHSAENEEQIQRMIDERLMYASGGLTAVDMNRDGRWDILATEYDRGAALFENDGRGGFVAKRLPLIGPKEAGHFYLWLDLDADGKEELVGTPIVDRSGRRAELPLYTWKRGKMERVRGALSFELPEGVDFASFPSATSCDLDGDGKLDLYFLGYNHSGSGSGFNTVSASDGMRDLLFINRGGLKFSEEAEERGIRTTKYSYVALCHDLDGDADPDLFVGNDYGTNDYFENLGAGRFRAVEAHPLRRAGSNGPAYAMGFSLADFDNTGRWSLAVSNMYSHAGSRMVPIAQGISDQTRAALQALAGGSTFFEQRDGGWVETGEARGVRLADWAWGSSFFDFDNDLDKDLYVVNGYHTHRDPDAPDY